MVGPSSSSSYNGGAATTTTSKSNHLGNGTSNNALMVQTTNNNRVMTIKTTSDFDIQVQELSEPIPESFTLTATLQLLDPFDTKTSVYLLTRSYLQNWLLWAYHQTVSKSETSRVDAALKLASERYGLTNPQDAVQQYHMDYLDPGPIDVGFLAMEGHDLLLSPNVVVKEGRLHKQSTDPHQDKLESEFPALLRRVKSLPTTDSSEDRNGTKGDKDDDDDPTNNNEGDNSTAATQMEDPLDSLDVEGDDILCCAVPKRFFEVSVCVCVCVSFVGLFYVQIYLYPI
jgi:hypothetical protein